MKNKKFICAVMIPALLHLCLFIVIPILLGLCISFFKYNPLASDNAFVGLANYKRMFADSNFRNALKNTVFFVGVTVTINICLSLVVTQLISYFKSNKVRSFFRMAFFLPCVAPIAASAVVFYRSIFPTKAGLLNMALNAIGLPSVNWLGDAKVILFAMVIYTIWVDVGYNIILFSAGIDGIPAYVYEAADLDGAGEWKKFRRITIPLLGRSFQFVLVQTLISHFQMFAQFMIMIYTQKNASLVLSKYIYQVAFINKEMGYASAVSMALFVIIMTLSVIERKLTKVDWEY